MVVVHKMLEANEQPSFTRVAKELGITKAGAQNHMRKLRAKGYLTGPRTEVIGSWQLSKLGATEIKKTSARA